MTATTRAKAAEEEVHHAAGTLAHGTLDPLAVLDHRLADGTISPEEYRERRAVLTDKDPGQS